MNSFTDKATLIAIACLQFLASREEEMLKFMSYSGFSANDFRSQFNELNFQAGLLSYLLENESILLTFCESQNIPPEVVSNAYHCLNQTQTNTKYTSI